VSTAEEATALGPRFAPGRWLPHFEKHGAEFGYKNSVEYLRVPAISLAAKASKPFTRANGDRLFYDPVRNEFAAMRPRQLELFPEEHWLHPALEWFGVEGNLEKRQPLVAEIAASRAENSTTRDSQRH
jgi:hypothetical protein